MQIKTAMSYHLTQVRVAIINKSTNNKCWRACVKKGFSEYFKECDADIFCIQESKLQEGQIDLEFEGSV